MSSQTLHILLETTSKIPYEETASADVLETFNNAVLGQLLTKNDAFELRPSLIKRWSWDFKKEVYDLILRDDIVFHNGRKATAKDLEFSLLRGFFTKYRSFYKMFLGNIEGIEETEKYKEFQSGAVPGVQITGPYSLRLKLKNPNPTFLYNLAYAYFSLVPREAFKKDLINWKDVPIGAGPYKMAEKDLKKGKFVLEKFRSSYPQAPMKIEIHTDPLSVEYDLVAYTDPPASSASYKPFHPKYSDAVWTIFFSNINALGESPVFRKAIQYAIDRDALLDGMDPWSSAYEMLPRHFWGRANLKDPYDPEKAKELLAYLPEHLLKQKWRIPVFSRSHFSKDREIALRHLKFQLEQVGLKVDFYPSQEKFLSKTTASSSPMRIAGMVADYTEPVTMYSAFREGSPFEYTCIAPPDEKFETLYERANKAQTPEERLNTVRKLSHYFNESAFAIPLAEMKQKYYVNSKTIQSLGEQPEPRSLFLERIVKKESR